MPNKRVTGRGNIIAGTMRNWLAALHFVLVSGFGFLIVSRPI
jgi:hypothetical protein